MQSAGPNPNWKFLKSKASFCYPLVHSPLRNQRLNHSSYSCITLVFFLIEGYLVDICGLIDSFILGNSCLGNRNSLETSVEYVLFMGLSPFRCCCKHKKVFNMYHFCIVAKDGGERKWQRKLYTS